MADSPPPMAAAKVFAIPELLEHILFYLVEASAGSKQIAPPKEIAEIGEVHPLASLAAIKRVDSMFRDTIETSKKLLRLIDRPLFSQSGPIPQFDLPAGFYLNTRKYSCKTALNTIHFIRVRIFKLDVACEASEEDHAMASWRNIKLIEADDKTMMTPSIRIEDYYQPFGRSATLGMVFDACCEILARSREKRFAGTRPRWLQSQAKTTPQGRSRMMTEDDMETMRA